MTTTTAPINGRVLLLTADKAMAELVQELATAAGVDLQVADDLAQVRQEYRTAPLVLVGADRADALSAALHRMKLRIRTDLDLLIPGDPADIDSRAIWGVAEEIGAMHVAILPTAREWLVTRLLRSHQMLGARRYAAGQRRRRAA